MPDSPLSFISTESFRKKLISKNLQPYKVTGVWTPPSGPVTYETNIKEINVIDSNDDLISKDPYAQLLYPLNQFGPSGGYNLNISYNNAPLPVNSNQGEYDPNDTKLDLVNEFFIDASYSENRYGPNGGYNDLVIIDNVPNANRIYAPYWDPISFVPSTYTPYQILLSTDPTGSSGLLSQDSFIAKLGAVTLKKLFQDRIDAEIYQSTIGLVNLESLSDPFEASLIAAGKEPLVYKNWTITVAENPVVAVTTFLTKLGGAYWPVSPIPGDYFNENVINGGASTQTSNALNVANQLTGGFLGPILNTRRNPSQIFLANTGNAQRSALFKNLDYNRYQPGYGKNFGGLLGVAQGVVNLVTSLINPSNGTLIGGYYVGNKNAEPSTITSPPNQIPVNPFGKQDPAPVYGPSELGQLYEGNITQINFGLAGKSISDGGGIDGQFVWVSPKYKGNAGYKATPGGGTGSLDEEFNLISSNYQRDESTNITYKQSSILDQTQRIVESADNVAGISRLKHVGNAINQVSKVFHDGYKEMTKGSQVVSYKDFTTGGEKGIEYCRVFTKDTPYYTYNDLQKVDGITTEGRRFTNSVLDNTFNLNIAPIRTDGSTNIVKDGPNGLGGYAKKYMFSLENLAWRTSDLFDQLPVCEKGPNGGRVMWFPPYDLKFSESSSPQFNSNNFLGRPEPIYTYKETSRTGQLSWKIIVDHPSVMNIVVEEQLKGANKERINSIMDSFFAGCVKFDIYELAKKFNKIPLNQLYTYQQILNNPRLTPEQLSAINNQIPKQNTDTGTGNGQNKSENTQDTSLTSFETTYQGLALYFDNDIPDPNSNGVVSSVSYESTYSTYTSDSNVKKYVDFAKTTFNSQTTFCKSNSTYCSENEKVEEFFNTIIKSGYNKVTGNDKNFITDAFEILSNKKGTIDIELVGSASAPASAKYNENLSKRRADSIIKFLKEKTVGQSNLSKFIEDKTLNFKISGEGEGTVIPQGELGAGQQVVCTQPLSGGTNAKIYSVNAMACRRVKFTIKVNPTPSNVQADGDGNINNNSNPSITPQNNVPIPQSTLDLQQQLKDGISKKVLRNLLSECDYFDVIKKNVPMVYDSIKEKIKYFNPSFHSMTPEGLNSRLTFLNQCVRPGNTIPVIGTDGKPRTGDAVNTSFGAPPILILRIGDFFHTKIVPTSLQISYEPLIYDMNPEGIGVQPMLANISMSFNIIGGMGLSKPVEQLQNALSFNYYANTEIYDERAVPTEDTSKLDKEVFQAILEKQKPTTIKDVDNKKQNDGGSTIGTILTNIPSATIQVGTISYQKIMDKLLDDTKTYMTNVANQMQKIVINYNYGIEQLVNSDRLYTVGTLKSNGKSYNLPIYGKPEKVEDKIQSVFKDVISSVENNSNPLISELINNNFDSTSKGLFLVKQNLIEYLTNLSQNFTTQVSNLTQELSLFEEGYVQNVRKLNLISDNTDGKILDAGVARVYNLTGTSDVSQTDVQPKPTDTAIEFANDYFNLFNTLKDYTSLLISNKIVDTTLYNNGDFDVVENGILTDIINKKFYMVISRILYNKNKKQEFINSIIKGELKTYNSPKSIEKVFTKIVDNLSDLYSKELKKEENKFEDFVKSPDYKKFINGLDQKMYPKGKTRVFTYSTQPGTNDTNQKNQILELYQQKNTGDNKTFDGKYKFQ